MSSNLHRNSTEANKHTPKGFDLADNNSTLLRDERGQSRYIDNLVNERVENLVDGNSAPPTTTSGHLYVLIDEGSGSVHADWNGANYDDIVRIQDGVWASITPVNGYLVFNKTDEKYYKFGSSGWNVFIPPVVWGGISGTLSDQTDLQNALNAKENSITAGTTGQYWRGDKTFQTLDKTAVGLSNVDNTSDANKPISTATQTALNLKLNIADAYGGKRYTLIKPNGTKEFYDNLTQVRSNWADGDVLHQFADEQISYADAGSGRMFILPAISWNGNGFKLDLVGTIVGSGTFFYCDNKQIYLFNLNIKFSGTAGTSRYIFHAFNSSVINGNSTVNVYSTSQVTLFREQNTSYFYNFNSFENASNVDLFVAGGAGGFYNIEAKGGILGANLNLFNCKFFNVTGNISGEFNNCFFELVAGTSIATSLTYTLNDCTVIRRGAGAGSTNLFGGDNMTLNNSIVIDYDGRTFSFSSGDDVIINNSTILNYSNNAVAYLLNTADSVISDSYIYANKICLSSNSNNGGKVVSSHIISRDENPVAFGNFNLIGCKLETRTSAKAIFTDNHDFLDCIFVGSNTPYTSTIKANNPYRLTQSIDHLGNVGAGLRSIYPKMTTAERDVLTGVEKGYAIENTTTNFLQVYNGSTWKDLLDLT